MKTIALLSLLSIATTAFADITMVQDTLLNGVSSRTTMYVKGAKVRTDNDTTSSTVIDTDTGDMITLMHEQKMKVKVNTKDLAALAKGQAPAESQTKVTATGQMETVDGHACEIYFSENMGMKVKLWVAKSYPNQEKLREQLKVMSKLAAPNSSKQPDVPGIAVKTEFEQQGLKFTTKLISLSDAPVDDSKFTIPDGYKAPGEN